MARTNDPLQMRVEEAKQRDIGKKRARIGPDAMDYLEVSPGDVIEISGKKSTCAIVWPSDEDEKYPDTIRIDGQTRKNIGVRLNDIVEIKICDETYDRASRSCKTTTEIYLKNNTPTKECEKHTAQILRFKNK